MSNLLFFCVCPSDPNFRKTFMVMVFPRFQEPSMPYGVMVNNWGSRFFGGALRGSVPFPETFFTPLNPNILIDLDFATK